MKDGMCIWGCGGRTHNYVCTGDATEAHKRSVEMHAATRDILRELADASEEYASSDPDMAGHDESERRFDAALAAARATL